MTHTLVVARRSAQVIGCAGLELYSESALLRSVAVALPVRGTGLGQALTWAALDLARGRGARRVYLLTETAEGFFPKFGFAPVERGAVDPAVLASEEFKTLCPVSAVAMVLDFGLGDGAEPSAEPAERVLGGVPGRSVVPEDFDAPLGEEEFGTT
jgi:amino-acid N-acetyltransferase